MKKEFSSLPSGLQDVTGPVDASTGGTTTTAKPSLKEEAKLAKVETKQFNMTNDADKELARSSKLNTLHHCLVYNNNKDQQYSTRRKGLADALTVRERKRKKNFFFFFILSFLPFHSFFSSFLFCSFLKGRILVVRRWPMERLIIFLSVSLILFSLSLSLLNQSILNQSINQSILNHRLF